MSTCCREAYFQRKAEERKREKEEKREATEAAAAAAALAAATSKAVQTKGAVLYFKGPLAPDTTREKIKVGLHVFRVEVGLLQIHGLLYSGFKNLAKKS